MSAPIEIGTEHDTKCSMGTGSVIVTTPTIVGLSTWPFRGFVNNPVRIVNRYSCRHGGDLPLPCAECHRVVL